MRGNYDMFNKVAAVVILYHFDNLNIEFIREYANQVRKVYCYDNTEIKNEYLVSQLREIVNVEYCGEINKGLAAGFNWAAKQAVKEGVRWLITFDQDSQVTKDMIPEMIQFAGKYKGIENVGIISPLINDKKLKFGIPAAEYSFYDRVIQSGAMHNLELFEKIGGYDENLFIDQVDFEFCLRLLKNGYKIIKLTKAVLLHNADDGNAYIEYRKGKKITVNKYSASRYYYIIRNNLYCGLKYKRFLKPYYAETRRNINSLWCALPYEENRGRKLKAMLFGYMDFMAHRMGKCRWNLK